MKLEQDKERAEIRIAELERKVDRLTQVAKGIDATTQGWNGDCLTVRMLTLVHGTAGKAAKIQSGTGTPESVVTGDVGDVFLRTDGGAGTTLYVKQSGTATNTGWIGK